MKIRKDEKHNLSESRIYSIWKNMRQRCINPKATKYDIYGGRGIQVCQKWLDSFICFYEDVGEPPSDAHQLDRINNNGNYEPSNISWVLAKTNSIKVRARRGKKCPYKGVKVHPPKRNKRFQATITIDGITKSLGYYKTGEEAALAYNKAAAEHFKEFAIINDGVEYVKAKED